MATDAQLVEYVRRVQRAEAEISARAVRSIGRAWERFGGLNDAALAAFRDAAVPIITEAISGASTLAAGSIGEYATLAGSRAPGALPALPYRGGVVTIGEVYTRPTIAARAAIAAGSTFREAMSAGAINAAQQADTDPALAARAAARAAMLRVPHVVGHRRVPDGTACELCLLAATQRYHVDQLQPRHKYCHCGVAPIIGTRDPGQTIDRESLQRLKDSGFVAQQQSERAARAAQDVGAVADRYRATAAHWREAAANAADPADRRRYEARAAEWEHKANVKANTLPAPNLDAGRQLAEDMIANPHAFIRTEVDHELGPLLVAA